MLGFPPPLVGVVCNALSPIIVVELAACLCCFLFSGTFFFVSSFFRDFVVPGVNVGRLII